MFCFASFDRTIEIKCFVFNFAPKNARQSSRSLFPELFVAEAVNA
jgi:hypothetical protein